MSARPTRRHELVIRLSADSVPDGIRALEQLAMDWTLHGVPPGSSLSAGWSSSWTVEHTERPEQTPERYRAELEAYVSPSAINHGDGET